MSRASTQTPVITYDQLVADIGRMLNKNFWPKGGHGEPGGGTKGWYRETYDTLNRMHLGWPSYYVINAMLMDLNVTFSQLVAEVGEQLHKKKPGNYRVIAKIDRITKNRTNAVHHAEEILNLGIALTHGQVEDTWSYKTLYETRSNGFGLFAPSVYHSLLGESLEAYVARLQNKPLAVGVPPETTTMADDFIQLMGPLNINNVEVVESDEPVQVTVRFTTSHLFWDTARSQRLAGEFAKKWAARLGHNVSINARYGDLPARVDSSTAYTLVRDLIQTHMKVTPATIRLVAPRGEVIVHHDGNTAVLNALDAGAEDFQRNTGWRLVLEGPNETPADINNAVAALPEVNTTENPVPVQPETLHRYAVSFTVNSADMGSIESTLKNIFGSPAMRLAVERITCINPPEGL